jgi:hypothetical protein
VSGVRFKAIALDYGGYEVTFTVSQLPLRMCWAPAPPRASCPRTGQGTRQGVTCAGTQTTSGSASLRAPDFSFKRLASGYGVSHNKVTSELRKQGVAIRTPKQARQAKQAWQAKQAPAQQPGSQLASVPAPRERDGRKEQLWEPCS